MKESNVFKQILIVAFAAFQSFGLSAMQHIPDGYDLVEYNSALHEDGVKKIFEQNSKYLGRFKLEDDSEAMIVEKDKKVCGFISYALGYTKEKGKIHFLGVSQDYRKKGLGSCLVKFALFELFAWGASKVCLSTIQTNKGGEVFYEKLGFKKNPPEPVYGCYRFVIEKGTEQEVEK